MSNFRGTQLQGMQPRGIPIIIMLWVVGPSYKERATVKYDVRYDKRSKTIIFTVKTPIFVYTPKQPINCELKKHDISRTINSFYGKLSRQSTTRLLI